MPPRLVPPLVALLLTGWAQSPLAAAPREPAPDGTPGVAARDTLRDLRGLFEAGGLVADLDGDSLVDAVPARIVLGPAPDAAVTAAAANLAARLGFETTATDLGLAGGLAGGGAGPGAGRPFVWVGDDATAAAGLDPAAIRRSLAPGQGAIVHVSAGATHPLGGVALVGYDATGLLAASAYLSARYPAVWAVDGPDWTRVTATVDSVVGDLAAGALTTLAAVVVDDRRPGVLRAEARVTVADAPGRAALLAALTAPAPDSTEADDDPRADLHVRDLHRLDVRVTGAGPDTVVSIRPPEPWSTRADGAFRAPPDAPFSLADLYAVGGLYRDTDQDLVPDRSRATLSLSGPGVSAGVVDLATRIGLETAGIRLPLARVGGEEDDPSASGFPILVGPGHHARAAVEADGGFPGYTGAAGTGYATLVERAFGPGAPDERRGGLVVDGADAAGVGAALDWLAGRVPWLWTPGKGEVRLADVQTGIRRFLQAREAPGQVALALAKLGAWMDRDAAAGSEPARVEIDLVARETPAGLTDLAESLVRERFPAAAVEASAWTSGYGVGDTIFVQEWDVPWEVDDVRSRLAADVYPRLAAGTPVEIEVRVSEPPEVRRALADEIRAAAEAAGASSVRVDVLNAYKQGYSWIEDVVLPDLRESDVASIEIRYHTLEESEEVRWQTIAADTRWLQELFPIDAVLARELAISDSAVTFVATRSADPVYALTARDGRGRVVHEATFTPRYVVRPYFDLFPEYEQVRVTTGWLRAAAGDAVLVDERIVTDPERFWDRLQTETFGAIVDYVLDTQDGDPSPANAPFFDEFSVELRLSEPNHRIGIDEEVISSLEALHEDVYFETLTLFDLIGARYQTSQSYPGRVLPWIDPSGAGRPGTARLTLTGKEKAGAELRVRTWASADDPAPVVRRYPLADLSVEAPRIVGAGFTAGVEGPTALQVRVEVPDSVDRYAEFEGRASEARIDAEFMNVDLLGDMVAALRRLHEAGLFEDVLSWDRVGLLALEVEVEDAPEAGRRLTVPRSSAPASTVAPRLMADGWRWDGSRMVQWNTPIPPSESDSILARLATFPEADVYRVAESFLGQPVWALDLLPSTPSAYRSQAKLVATRPTLFISGRQHANEVSSTSHILRLAELIVTDSTYRALLDRVNVVLHPITNPDGARLAVEMQETNPDFMLHAGYLGSLGVDATSGERSDDPIYPESQARRRIREDWLPDVYINMHGYPSHEWVQYFAGYSAWVRGRQGGQRSWWAPRGWFIPGISVVEDDDHPDYATAQWAVLDSVAASITGEPQVEAMNRRMYARYRKYGVQDRNDFTEFFHRGMLVNLALRGPESIGTGLYSPRVTWFSTTTEAPDETARGDWLELVATAGLAHSSALLRYLAAGPPRVERDATADEGGVTRTVVRTRPVLPPEADGDAEEGGEGVSVPRR